LSFADSVNSPGLVISTRGSAGLGSGGPLRDTPIVDKSTCVLMANNEIILDLIEKGELERARHVTAWNIWAAKAYGVKAVNPGGVAAWKWGKDAKGMFAVDAGSTQSVGQVVQKYKLRDKGVKAGGYFPGNMAKGMTNHQSTVLLFDPDTGVAIRGADW